MLVSELIAKLQTCDQSAQVFVNYDGEFCSEVTLEDPVLIDVSNEGDIQAVVLLSLTGDSSWELPTQD